MIPLYEHVCRFVGFLSNHELLVKTCRGTEEIQRRYHSYSTRYIGSPRVFLKKCLNLRLPCMSSAFPTKSGW